MIEHVEVLMIHFTGIEITKARDKIGMSQEELAEKMGVTQQFISKMEKPERNFYWHTDKFKLFTSYFTT